MTMKLFISFCLTIIAFSNYPLKAQRDNLPDIGSSASKGFSIAKEQAVGDSYMRQLRTIAPLINDAEINDYIQHLGFKLVESNPQATGRKFSFFVINQNSINAFALPGGYIGVHTGLITKSANESELASVLAHEIAHVTQRHLARRIELQNQLTLPSLAAFAAAILVASQSNNADAGAAAIIGTQGLTKQAVINHTRSNEAEADRIGIETLYLAGFNPNAAVSFFEKMQANSRYRSDFFEFLQTHPLSRNRITDARLRAAKFPRRPVIEKSTYRLIKAKIKALTTTITPALLIREQKRFQEKKFKNNEQLYGYAILLKKANKLKQAEQILVGLIKHQPKQTSYAIALAELDIMQNKAKRSLPIIEKFLSQIPGNLALVEINAKLLLETNQPLKARSLLLENIHMTRFAPHLFKLLSQAQQKAGFLAEVFESEGNYLVSIGDLNGATNQYYHALNAHTEDPYARERINAQLRLIKEYLYKRRLQR